MNSEIPRRGRSRGRRCAQSCRNLRELAQQKIAGTLFGTSEKACAKLSYICCEFESQFRTILCKYPFSNALLRISELKQNFHGTAPGFWGEFVYVFSPPTKMTPKNTGPDLICNPFKIAVLWLSQGDHVEPYINVHCRPLDPTTECKNQLSCSQKYKELPPQWKLHSQALDSCNCNPLSNSNRILSFTVASPHHPKKRRFTCWPQTNL